MADGGIETIDGFPENTTVEAAPTRADLMGNTSVTGDTQPTSPANDSSAPSSDDVWEELGVDTDSVLNEETPEISRGTTRDITTLAKQEASLKAIDELLSNLRDFFNANSDMTDDQLTQAVFAVRRHVIREVLHNEQA